MASGRTDGSVSKGKRNRDNRRRERRTSALSDHRRKGKVLTPPMMTIPNMVAVPWFKDSLPNCLWLCWQVSSEDYFDVFATSKYLDEIETGLGEDRIGFPDDWLLTGKLSDFEAVPQAARVRVLDHLMSMGAYDSIVPEEFAIALAMYPEAPGRWLIQPWLESGLVVDPAVAERGLRDVVGKAFDGRGDVATRAKALVFRQIVKAGRVSYSDQVMTAELMDAFRRYPRDASDEQKALVESHVRAAFLAMETMSEGELEWPTTFWRANWKLYSCQTSNTEPGPDVLDGSSDEVKEALRDLHAEVESLWNRFAGVAKTTDPDLYSPYRFEVLTGLVGRALRLVRTIAGYPLMWTMEHGAPVLRALVESRIIIRYLVAHDDPALYDKFRAYGVGHLKLLKLHLEQFMDAAGEAGDGMKDYLELISDYVNRDQYEEFVSIDLGGNFAGVDMRRMSDETDLGDDYRLLFQPASSNVHGEWGAIDMNVFQPCLNPLHRSHRVLADSDRTVVGPRFLHDLMDYAAMLIEEYDNAVKAAASPDSGEDSPAPAF